MFYKSVIINKNIIFPHFQKYNNNDNKKKNNNSKKKMNKKKYRVIPCTLQKN